MNNRNQFSGFFPHPLSWVEPVPTVEEIIENQQLLALDAKNYDRSGYTVRVARDGMILLQINTLEDEIKEINKLWEGDLTRAKSYGNPWAIYIKHLNVLYFLLECGMHIPGKHNHYTYDYCELGRTDMRRVTYDESDIVKSQAIYGHQTRQDLIRRGKIEMEATSSTRSGIKPVFFDEMVILYDEVIEKGLIDDVAGVGKSVSLYKTRDFKSCLLWSWILLETHISWLWEQYLLSNNISGDQKKRMGGRDYTISIKIDSLKISGVIENKDYEVLDNGRKSRNDLVHEGKLKDSRPQIVTTCRDMINLVRKFFKERHNIDLSFSDHPHGTHGL